MSNCQPPSKKVKYDFHLIPSKSNKDVVCPQWELTNISKRFPGSSLLTNIYLGYLYCLSNESDCPEQLGLLWKKLTKKKISKYAEREVTCNISTLISKSKCKITILDAFTFDQVIPLLQYLDLEIRTYEWPSFEYDEGCSYPKQHDSGKRAVILLKVRRDDLSCGYTFVAVKKLENLFIV